MIEIVNTCLCVCWKMSMWRLKPWVLTTNPDMPHISKKGISVLTFLDSFCPCRWPQNLRWMPRRLLMILWKIKQSEKNWIKSRHRGENLKVCDCFYDKNFCLLFSVIIQCLCDIVRHILHHGLIIFRCVLWSTKNKCLIACLWRWDAECLWGIKSLMYVLTWSPFY